MLAQGVAGRERGLGNVTYLLYRRRHDCGVALVLLGIIVCLRAEDCERDSASMVFGIWLSCSNSQVGILMVGAKSSGGNEWQGLPRKLDVTVWPHSLSVCRDSDAEEYRQKTLVSQIEAPLVLMIMTLAQPLV